MKRVSRKLHASLKRIIITAAAVLLAFALFIMLWVFVLFPQFFDPNLDVVDPGESPVGIVSVVEANDESLEQETKNS